MNGNHCICVLAHSRRMKADFSISLFSETDRLRVTLGRVSQFPAAAVSWLSTVGSHCFTLQRVSLLSSVCLMFVCFAQCLHLGSNSNKQFPAPADMGPVCRITTECLRRCRLGNARHSETRAIFFNDPLNCILPGIRYMCGRVQVLSWFACFLL